MLAVDEQHGEWTQGQELSQQDDQMIEWMIEQMDKNMVQEQQDQNTDLMPRVVELTPKASPPSTLEKVQSEQGETLLLDDDLEKDVCNLTFDDSQ